jgi:hypothetical protein
MKAHFLCSIIDFSSAAAAATAALEMRGIEKRM